MLPDLFRDTWRLLTFRLKPSEFESFGTRHLLFGLALCWLAGIGRFWAASHMPWYGRIGVGSLLYPFVFALPLALLTWPLAGRWQYRQLVTFIALTGPLAFLYAPLAPPVLGVEWASITRFGALALVSLWRVCLLFLLLRRYLALPTWMALPTGSLLLTGIVSSLTFLNLERAVFAMMGPAVARTMSDDSYAFLFLLGALSVVLLPVFLIWYFCAIYGAVGQRADRLESQREASS